MKKFNDIEAASINNPDNMAWFALKNMPLKVMLLLTKSTLEDNYLISINRHEIARFTGISLTSSKRAVKWLIENGFIVIHTPPHGKVVDTVFMLNPSLIRIGSAEKQKKAEKDFKKLASNTALDRFECYKSTPRYKTVTKVETISKSTLKSSTLVDA